jgi:hypothetical protein
MEYGHRIPGRIPLGFSVGCLEETVETHRRKAENFYEKLSSIVLQVLVLSSIPASSGEIQQSQIIGLTISCMTQGSYFPILFLPFLQQNNLSSIKRN